MMTPKDYDGITELKQVSTPNPINTIVTCLVGGAFLTMMIFNYDFGTRHYQEELDAMPPIREGVERQPPSDTLYPSYDQILNDANNN